MEIGDTLIIVRAKRYGLDSFFLDFLKTWIPYFAWKTKDQARHIKVFIDEQDVGTVNRGEQENFAVEPGKHSIHIGFRGYVGPSLLWFDTISKKIEFEVNKGEAKLFVCYANPFFTTFLGLGIISLCLEWKFTRDLIVYLKPGASDISYWCAVFSVLISAIIMNRLLKLVFGRSKVAYLYCLIAGTLD